MRRTAFFAALSLAACGATLGGSSGDAGRDGGDAGHPHPDAGRSDAATTDARPDHAAGDAGVVCYANTDCVGGTCGYSKTTCVGHDCSTVPACPGTCTAYASDGGFCLSPGPPACPPESGLVCDPFSHRCVPPSSEKLPVVDAGAPCGLGVANCGPGDFCYAPVFPDNGVCLPVIHDGGGCDPSNPFGDCAKGLVCAGYGSSLDGGVCRPPSPAGGPCVMGADGGSTGSSGCEDDAVCLDGGCVALPSTGPCVAGHCDPDAGYCSSKNRCVEWSPNGAACTSPSQCASGLCASTTHECVAALPNGAECTGGPYDCSGGLCKGDAAGCESEIVM